MKLTNKIALISGLGCLALVGTGFAAWSYIDASNVSNGTVTATAAATKVVTNSVTGTISFKEGTISAYVLLDEKDVSSAGAIEGIAFWSATATGDETSTSATLPTITPVFTMSDGAAVPSYLTYTYTVAVAATDTSKASLKDYVADFSTTTGVAWTSGTAITLPTLTFTQSAAPQSKAAYDVMVAALANTKITFTFSAANA